ncbi:hypothetical protein M422DRAFT_253320 [Sphaerobolus stellatus SS14]|uniref:Uncharacterized protein n=1 Tax=Sphaerobolus stellatus (strain SS14) TaxID=990650 RepID=A0A0C9VX86_SPHS4|nr:hypothetical protein M422DRAFT_253320 [Sphaerobolus stellatus SS14]
MPTDPPERRHNEEEGQEEEEKLGLADAIKFCISLEMLCMQFEPPDDVLDITRHLRQLRIHFKKLESKNVKQVTLDRWLSLAAKQVLKLPLKI